MSSKTSPNSHGLDALLPNEMALKSEAIGEKKAKLKTMPTFVLAVLAGAFIALGAFFYTVVVTTGGVEMSFGLKKLLGGIAFSLGLILVVVAGAELFTGNNLIVMAWASGRISVAELLRNWMIVYAGNFVGAIGIAGLICLAELDQQGTGAVGETMMAIAVSKCSLSWTQAIAAGIGCNVLVCLAVWLCMSARSVVDKIAAIVFPIAGFVATGMEHCVANMYFVPAALLVGFRKHISGMPADEELSQVSPLGFVSNNLVPVTIGNVIGGSVLVGLVYWFVYLKQRNSALNG